MTVFIPVYSHIFARLKAVGSMGHGCQTSYELVSSAVIQALPLWILQGAGAGSCAYALGSTIQLNC